MNIVNSLANADYLRDDVATTEYLKMIDLINETLGQPCPPKNTPEQDLWCKARGISHELQNHKNRENGYVKDIGKVYTT